MVVVIICMLGLCFGSFVNALVWRIHEQNKPKKKRAASDKDLSITSGRSMCVHCHHALAWYDLLPVVSWLSLGGKCRYCHKSISWQYPVVELSTAALFLGSYYFWPSTLHNLASSILFGFWLVFLVGFMALTVYDLKWMILPNRIVFPLQALAVLYVVFEVLFTDATWHIALSALLGVLCSAGLFYVLFQVSKGKWIGGGDVKLAVIIGVLVGGPVHAFLMLFIASLIGSTVGIPLMLAGKAKRSTKLPFGPFLIVAAVIVYLFGASLVSWYQHTVLIV